jgi:hypothetical protein
MASDALGPTLRDARVDYFVRSGFPSDGGYGDRWVRLELGPLPIWFPNTSGRVRAVRFHDLHHVLTGYDTTWTGEAEIGAWEVASGCAHHYAAWVLNLWALGIGLLIAPGATFRAFVRGRHTRNLYRETFDEALLEERVAAARARLRLDAAPPSPDLGDRLAFAAWGCLSIVAVAIAALSAPALFGVLAYVAYRSFG